MKYKEFRNWCSDRAADGCWGMNEAIICIGVMSDINALHFWQREKIWNELYKDEIVNKIVKPTNEKIKEVLEQLSKEEGLQ